MFGIISKEEKAEIAQDETVTFARILTEISKKTGVCVPCLAELSPEKVYAARAVARYEANAPVDNKAWSRDRAHAISIMNGPN